MDLSERQIKEIVENTIRQLTGEGRKPEAAAAPHGWLFDTVNEAVAAAADAQRALARMSLDMRKKLIAAMREAAVRSAKELAKMACEETGYGRTEDKVKKCLLAAEKTPGVEDLESKAISGDFGLTLVECAPYGVIGAITPSTNPPSTVINNSISMIAAGNAVVFSPHPAAKNVSIETMRILNEAIKAAGGPEALICTVKNPGVEAAAELMRHPGIAMLAVTGGEAVVKAAMVSGKKVIAAGPGNPPVIVDETADLPKAARDIVDGASFDNNILCIAEKEVFVVSRVAAQLIQNMERCGAFKIAGLDIDKVMSTVLVRGEAGFAPNKQFVGKDAAYILEKSGVPFSGTPRLIICEVEKKHPFVMTEMLMPVLPIVRVTDINEAIACALEAEQGRWHSAMIHSTNIKNLSDAAHTLNTTVFVKNAPSYAGLGFTGEGYATLTIATPTGEGLTSAKSFTRSRRCVLYGSFRIV